MIQGSAHSAQNVNERGVLTVHVPPHGHVLVSSSTARTEKTVTKVVLGFRAIILEEL